MKADMLDQQTSLTFTDSKFMANEWVVCAFFVFWTQNYDTNNNGSKYHVLVPVLVANCSERSYSTYLMPT